MKTQGPNELTNADFWSETWDAQSPQRRLPSWFRSWFHKRVRRHSIDFYRKLCELAGCSAGELFEIGCGSGLILEEIHAACPAMRLHGIDYSESGLAGARIRLQAAGIAATLHFGDVSQVDLPDRYDLVLSGGVIEHFVDPLPMVQAHVRLCKPGGHVLLVVPNFSESIPRFFHQRFDPKNLAAHNLAILGTAPLREIMVRAGLEDVQVGESGPPRIHDCAEPSIRFGKLYTACAMGWNLITHVFPFPPLWHCHIWGLGRRPLES